MVARLVLSLPKILFGFSLTHYGNPNELFGQPNISKPSGRGIKTAVYYINSVHVGNGQDRSVFLKHVCCPCSHVFPGGSLGKESACNVGDHVQFWLGQVDPLQKEMTTYSNILA